MAIDTNSRFDNIVSRLNPSRQTERTSLLPTSAIDSSKLVGLRLQASTSVNLSDQGKLRAALENLDRDLGKRFTAASAVPVKASSSDTDVLSAKADKAQKTPGQLQVEVKQLAQGQKLRSQAFADQESSIIGTGALTIQFGSYNSGTNDFTPNDTASKSITINASNGTLGGIASSINRADVGISAEVVEDGDQYRLELTGKQSGREQAFRITVRDDDNSPRDNISGLSRLAYDPQEPPDFGQNQTVLQSAQDAEFSINGQSRSTSSNRYDDVDRGVSLSFKAAGNASVEFKRDAAQAFESASKLAQSVNRFVERATELQGSGLSRKVGKELAQAVSNAETGSGLNRLTLSAIGITQEKNELGSASLKIDKEKFDKAFQSRPDDVAALLGETAAQLGEISARNQQSLQRNTLPLQASNGDNPYVAQARAQRFQALSQNQTTLLSYSPTTRNLYGLAQYLSVAGL